MIEEKEGERKTESQERKLEDKKEKEINEKMNEYYLSVRINQRLNF